MPKTRIVKITNPDPRMRDLARLLGRPPSDLAAEVLTAYCDRMMPRIAACHMVERPLSADPEPQAQGPRTAPIIRDQDEQDQPQPQPGDG